MGGLAIGHFWTSGANLLTEFIKKSCYRGL
jgi:hypothetical protein